MYIHTPRGRHLQAVVTPGPPSPSRAVSHYATEYAQYPY